MELDQRITLPMGICTSTMHLDEMSDQFRQLGIHDDACINHTTRFPEPTTELWKNFVWVLEDTAPGGCRDLVVSLLQVPIHTQREFIHRASAAFIKPTWRYDAKLKNFGIPYHVLGESALLIGQLYENWGPNGLATNVVECFGLEFGGRFPICIVISLDMLGQARPTILKLRRTDLWPSASDLGQYIHYNCDDGKIACGNS
jgi:hypothetical protein